MLTVLKKPLTILLEEKGAVLILVALAMTVLFVFLGLVVDAGLGYLTRARLTATVDAAALAGAQELPADPSGAAAVAKEYAASNGLPAEQVAVEVSPDQKSITVEGQRRISFFLGQFLGQSEAVVRARALAQVASPQGVWGAAPLAVEDHQLEFGARYVLKNGAGEYESHLGPGNFGALSLGGTGASKYEENLKYGYQEMLKVGDQVDTETGNMSNPTKRAIDYRLDRCPDPSCSPAGFSRDCQHILIVPLYQTVETEGQQIKKVLVSGFAAFYVEKVEGQGNDSYIYGYFVRTLAKGMGELSGVDTGLYVVRLVQ